MSKLQETKNGFFISIPKDIIAKKGWKKGFDLSIGIGRYGIVQILDNEDYELLKKS